MPAWIDSRPGTKSLRNMDEFGLLDQVEKKKIMQPLGDRSHVVIEPMLTDQWYVDAKTLAQPAIKAVEEDQTRFVPENWSKTYYNWMRDIEPWCVSRQLWWGHRIPAWFGPDGKTFVALTENDAAKQAEEYYGPINGAFPKTKTYWTPGSLQRFGRSRRWDGREESEELKAFYPTSVLVTGFDIIFFWVARHDDAGHSLYG